ncbi:MAG TPA: C4-dicarboxylate transporter DctA, partial [Cupriavidus sp.]|nr:C4-dicarboxylate transporter DctA [Cupriavidus sp.]
ILAATLSAHPAIPAIGLVLVLSVDWFIGIARAVGNLIGNCVATVVVAAWERDIDRERAHGVLNGTIPAGELEEGLTVHEHGSGEVPVPAPLPGVASGR